MCGMNGIFGAENLRFASSKNAMKLLGDKPRKIAG